MQRKCSVDVAHNDGHRAATGQAAAGVRAHQARALPLKLDAREVRAHRVTKHCEQSRQAGLGVHPEGGLQAKHHSASQLAQLKLTSKSCMRSMLRKKPQRLGACASQFYDPDS